MIPHQHTIDTPYMVGPVHCYTVDCGEELVLFDTGPPTVTGRKFLQEQIDLKRLKHVLVTHCHIDHSGQSRWLEENSDAAVYLPRLDILRNRHLDRRMEIFFTLVAELGFADGYIEELRQRLLGSTQPSLLPRNYLVAETDIPAHLGVEVVACPGHSQSDLVYCGNGWAVTGDILLRGVFQSPLLDVDLESVGRFKNYEAYCRSVVKLARLGAKRILPGHRGTVDSVDKTILFYITKLLRRVGQLLPHFDSYSVAEVIDRVFPSMNDPFHIYLKASEIVFMKDFLAQPQLLSSSLAEIGLFDQVVDLFQEVLEKR